MSMEKGKNTRTVARTTYDSYDSRMATHTSKWPTSQRWMTNGGASVYQRVVRMNGWPDYNFDKQGQRDIIMACNSHGPTESRSVQKDIIDSAARRGATQKNATVLVQQYDIKRKAEIAGTPIGIRNDPRADVREEGMPEIETPMYVSHHDAARHALLVQKLNAA